MSKKYLKLTALSALLFSYFPVTQAGLFSGSNENAQKCYDSVESGKKSFAKLACQKSAEQGDAKSQFYLGRLYLDNADTINSKRWIEKAAEQKYPEALFYVARFYAQGQGVGQNSSMAQQYYQQSCQSGFQAACEFTEKYQTEQEKNAQAEREELEKAATKKAQSILYAEKSALEQQKTELARQQAEIAQQKQALEAQRIEAKKYRVDPKNYQFNDGLAKFSENGKWGYIDKNGNIVIEPEFQYVANFYEGLAAVQNIQGKWGFLNTRGQFAIQPKFDCVARFKEGLAGANVGGSGSFQRCDGGKWGFIDKNGLWKIEPIFDEVNMFEKGKSRVRINADVGYINGKGDWLETIKKEYTAKNGTKISQYEFREGIAKIELNKLWGFVDENGKIVVSPQFTRVGNFYEGRAAVKTTAGYWGYLDKNGNYAISPKFGCIYRFSEGVAAVNLGGHQGKDGSCQGGSWGYVDYSGNWQINPTLEYAEMFKNGVAKVKYQGQWRKINRRWQFVD